MTTTPSCFVPVFLEAVKIVAEATPAVVFSSGTEKRGVGRTESMRRYVSC
jgi:hypothetical protein